MLHILRRGSIQLTFLISETFPGTSWLAVWLGLGHYIMKHLREERDSLTVENHSHSTAFLSFALKGKPAFPLVRKTKYNEQDKEIFNQISLGNPSRNNASFQQFMKL